MVIRPIAWNLQDEQIIKGFLKHYVIFDLTISDVKRDILFHTNYGEDGVKQALSSLKDSIENIFEKEVKHDR